MRVGRHEVLGTIGRGGAGVVLKGRAPDGRIVAIKMLKLGATPDALARFERERRALAELGEDAGFVALLESGTTPEGPFLVMPFLEGGTLRSRLLKGPLSWVEAVALVRRLASSLGAAHALGLVHRDLKPENVLFDAHGRAFVADLGLAKFLAAEADPSLTGSNELKGTFGYMPPEQLSDARSAGPPADVFALGGILYECIAGQPAFDATTFEGMHARVTQGAFAPLEKLRPGTPSWIARIVERCLRPEPGRRFADGAALASALGAGDGRTMRAPVAILLVCVVASIAAGVALSGSPRRVEGIAPSVSVTTTADVRSASPPVAPDIASTDTEAPADASAWPRSYRGFAGSPSLQLSGVWGATAWRARSPLASLAVSPDGRKALTGTGDGDAILWDLATGEPERTLGRGRGAVGAVAFSADGDLLALANAESGVTVWTRAGVSRAVFDGPRGVTALALSPDGTRVLAAAEDGALEVRALGGAPAVAPPAPGKVLALSADGRRVLYGMQPGVATVELVPGGAVRKLNGRFKVVIAAALSWTGSHALTFGGDEALRIWDTTSGEEVFMRRLRVAATAFAVSRDATRALSADGPEGTVRLSDLTTTGTAAYLGHLKHGAKVTGVAFTPDGRRGFSAGSDGTLACWDTGAAIAEVSTARPGGAHAVASLAFSADGTQLLAASEDGRIRIVVPESGRTSAFGAGSSAILRAGALRTTRPSTFVAARSDGSFVTGPLSRKNHLALRGGGSPVRCAAFSADGERAIVGGADGSVHLFVVGRDEDILLAGPGGEETAVAAMSADGRRAITATARGPLAVWDVERATKRELELAGFAPLAHVAFLEGERIFCASARSAVVDLATARVVLEVARDERLVASALSPRAPVLATAARGGEVALIDLASGHELDRIDLGAASDAPASLAFALDGRALYVGTARGAVLRFDVR